MDVRTDQQSFLDAATSTESWPIFTSNTAPLAPQGDAALLGSLLGNFTEHAPLIPPVPLKTGHINKTYIGTVKDAAGEDQRYILQWINHEVFRDIPGLMRNIASVTAHLNSKPDTISLSVVPTREGASYILDSEGGAWRTYKFIEGTRSMHQCTSETIAYQSGSVLARFQRDLADFDATQLVATIPHFHDALRRYAALETALTENRAGRAIAVGAEIDFARECRDDLGRLIEALHTGALPMRVTHNDMKLNNILFLEDKDEALCIVDLDTVMPGSLLFDYGDLLRNVAVLNKEDERDLSKVQLSHPFFAAASRGYASEMREVISPEERQFLHQAPTLMGLMLGVRFLTDYLNGDTYFGIDYRDHNLDRARCQFEIVRQFQRHESEIIKLIGDIF